MKNIHIDNGYNVWLADEMDKTIISNCMEKYDTCNAGHALNRSYSSMHIEWWLHNIIYYITKPFCHIDILKDINERCKDIELNEKE